MTCPSRNRRIFYSISCRSKICYKSMRVFKLGKTRFKFWPCLLLVWATWTSICYDLDLGCPPKFPCIWKVIGSQGHHTHKWFVHWWVHSCLAIRRWAWLEISHLECDLKGCLCLPSSSLFSLLPGCHRLRSFPSFILLCHVIPFLQSADHRLSWKPINLSSFKLWVSGIVSQQGECVSDTASAAFPHLKIVPVEVCPDVLVGSLAYSIWQGVYEKLLLIFVIKW